MSFAELLEHDWPLALDAYQRGFVWDDEKVEQLIGDLETYQKDTDQKLPYYMGTLLLHHDAEKKKRFIIDGQQRTTALCLLYYRLVATVPKGQDLTYSGQSARRIKNVVGLLKDGNRLPDTKVFERLRFTVISVTNADLAFTFFDTQNNRGVRLQATDLLKAYHLRSIDQNSDDKTNGQRLQKACATRWEQIQRQTPILSSGSDFAPNLFARFLWRARRWQGAQVKPAHQDSLLKEFQANTWAQDKDTIADVDTIPIYACRTNQLAQSMRMQNGTLLLQGSSITLSSNAASLPMALRQPIHKGMGFFLYAEKYAALLKELHSKQNLHHEVREFQAIHENLLLKNQVYLREAFWLASLMYVDQFGYQKLATFALYLEFILGSIRLAKHQIKRETAANFFRDGKLNLLDVIAQSYHPHQVLDYLIQQHPRYDQSYQDERVDPGKGVRGRYKKAVVDFFNSDDDQSSNNLANKLSWMNNKVKALNDD